MHVLEEITYTRESLDKAQREIMPDIFKHRFRMEGGMISPFMEKVAVKCFLYPHLGETEAGKIVRKAMLDLIYYGQYFFQEVKVKVEEQVA